MLVSHRKRFIYTKTIKTGSTTVEVYFEPYCFPDGAHVFTGARRPYESETGIVGFRGIKRPDDGYRWYNHMPADEISAGVGPDVWNNYFKFCCVRNPFDRLVSAFHHLVLPKERCVNLSFSQIKEQFGEWIASHRFLTECSLNDWKICTLDDQPCVNYVIRHEELLAGIKEVCRRLDLSYEPDRVLHMQGHYNPKVAPFGEYYDSNTAAIAAQHYALQLQAFGYHPPDVN